MQRYNPSVYRKHKRSALGCRICKVVEEKRERIGRGYVLALTPLQQVHHSVQMDEE